MFGRRTDYDNEKIAWIRLARTDGIGPVRMARLISRFGSAIKAVEAFPHLTLAQNMTLPSLTRIEDEITEADIHKAQIICLYEDAYPEALRMISDPPPVLTVRGNIDLLPLRSVGIVGTRNASLNGRKMTGQLAQEIGEASYNIVSGMARGIDTAAHEAALRAGVNTVAVLAGGVDQIYPKENDKLYAALIERGAVISESAWGVSPNAKLFPKRNRIVSGLSLALIVVEAAIRSGSLITARLAMEQGREVFAVPGSPLDGRSAGPNSLIQQGAKLITNATDVLEDIVDMAPKPLSIVQRMQENQNDLQHDMWEDEEEIMVDVSDSEKDGDSPQIHSLEDRILSQMTSTPSSVDELIRALEEPASAVQTALMMLELEQKVERLHGNRVALCA